MSKALSGYVLTLAIASALATAQTSVRELDIDSGWGGLGTPQSTHLASPRVGFG